MPTHLNYSHEKSDSRGKVNCLSRDFGQPGESVVPEETVFGILSRYHVLTGRVWCPDTLVELMNRRTFSPGTAFPSGLNTILAHLDVPIPDLETLIRNHTILPYFRPFSSGAQYKAVFELVKSGNAAATKISLGMIASRIGAEDWLRFCPLCAAEDIEMIGSATWYRAHQLPGVLMCPYHAVPLMENKCLVHRIEWQKLFLPQLDNGNFHSCVGGNHSQILDKLLLIAKLSAQTLTLSGRPFATQPLRNLYVTHLLERGLASSPNRVRQRELHDQFREYWQPLSGISPFNRLLGTAELEAGWLATLSRKSRFSHHPLKHLLLIGFLVDDLFSFFTLARKQIGTVKLPRQRTTLHSRAVMLQLEDMVVRHGISIHCASERIGITTNTGIQYAEKAGIPVSRRPKKLNASLNAGIREELAAGKGVQAIARDLGVSTTTINRSLGNDLNLQQLRANRKYRDRQKQSRAKLLETQRRLPQAGFKLLHTKIPADFMWLYRHDNEWLRQQIRPAQQRDSRNTKIDWANRDAATAVQVSRATMEILNSSEKPVRVTVNELGRRTGHLSWLQKQLDKLPRTSSLLQEVLEPVEAFQARRIRWWEKQLSSSGLLCAAQDWRVLRAAGIPTRVVYC